MRVILGYIAKRKIILSAIGVLSALSFSNASAEDKEMHCFFHGVQTVKFEYALRGGELYIDNELAKNRRQHRRVTELRKVEEEGRPPSYIYIDMQAGWVATFLIDFYEQSSLMSLAPMQNADEPISSINGECEVVR